MGIALGLPVPVCSKLKKAAKMGFTQLAQPPFGTPPIKVS
jgi:hypothetical protein